MRLLTDEEFTAAWYRGQCSPKRVGQITGLRERSVYRRRLLLVAKGIVLPTNPPAEGPGTRRTEYQTLAAANAYKPRATDTIKDGHLIVFSDAHYWPGEISLAHEALLKVVKMVKPQIVIGNGDLFDGARISRHEPMGWQKLPTVIEELDTVKLRLDEIRRAYPASRRYLTVGNHDSRFDRRLATEVAEFEDVPGMRLEHHLKDWPMSYSVLLNEYLDPVFVLHNIRGGMHAPFNNVKAAGCTVITGHLHSQKAQPYTTMLHDWEGIDAGCLADVNAPAFSYAMDRPRDWRSGFAVMRFDKEGRRFPVDLCRVQNLKGKSRAIFRGEIVAERSAPL